MDPISAGTVGTVISLAVGCGKDLATFISNAKDVDVNVKALYDEVGALERTSRAVEATLERGELEAFQDAALWDDSRASLAASAASLRSLQDDIREIRSAKDKDKPMNDFRKTITQFKLNMQEDQIRKHRDQLHSHRLGLLAIVQIVAVHVSATGPSIILDHLVPRIQLLERSVALIQESNSRIEHRLADGSDQNESIMLRVNKRVVRTAQSLIHGVASTIADDARSTIFGGTELDLDFASNIGGARQEGISFTGLKTKHSIVSGWVDSHVDGLQTEDNITGRIADPTISSSILSQQTTGSDSDDEFSRDYVEKCVALAEKARNLGDYANEESFLRKAFANPRQLSRLGNHNEEMDLTLLLAKSLLQQGKYSETRSLCDELLQTKIRGDPDRVLIHEGLFMLAQVDLIEDMPHDATLKCKQVINGRRKLGGRDNAYYEAIALMAAIKQQQGDEHERQVYDELLPEDFTRPAFRRAQPKKEQQFKNRVTPAIYHIPSNTIFSSQQENVPLRAGESTYDRWERLRESARLLSRTSSDLSSSSSKTEEAQIQEPSVLTHDYGPSVTKPSNPTTPDKASRPTLTSHLPPRPVAAVVASQPAAISLRSTPIGLHGTTPVEDRFRAIWPKMNLGMTKNHRVTENRATSPNLQVEQRQDTASKEPVVHDQSTGSGTTSTDILPTTPSKLMIKRKPVAAGYIQAGKRTNSHTRATSTEGYVTQSLDRSPSTQSSEAVPSSEHSDIAGSPFYPDLETGMSKPNVITGLQRQPNVISSENPATTLHDTKESPRDDIIGGTSLLKTDKSKTKANSSTRKNRPSALTEYQMSESSIGDEHRHRSRPETRSRKSAHNGSEHSGRLTVEALKLHDLYERELDSESRPKRRSEHDDTVKTKEFVPRPMKRELRPRRRDPDFAKFVGAETSCAREPVTSDKNIRTAEDKDMDTTDDTHIIRPDGSLGDDPDISRERIRQRVIAKLEERKSNAIRKGRPRMLRDIEALAPSKEPHYNHSDRTSGLGELQGAAQPTLTPEYKADHERSRMSQPGNIPKVEKVVEDAIRRLILLDNERMKRDQLRPRNKKKEPSTPSHLTQSSRSEQQHPAKTTSSAETQQSSPISFTVPDDGRAVYISKPSIGPETSQSSLLIEYYEGGKTSLSGTGGPSVRVKVRPSSKSTKDLSDRLMDDEQPDYVKRIPLAVSNSNIKVSRDVGS